MKSFRVLSLNLLVIGFIAFLSDKLMAQSVPALINYQGKLVNPNGLPVSTGDYQLRFRIYDAATNGNLIWGPQVFNGQAGPGYGPVVSVVQGWFNVILGPTDTNGVPIVNALSGTNRFIEIQLNNGVPFSPRQQILSAPYALKAERATISEGLTPGVAAANLSADGFSAVPKGGMILSPLPNDTNITSMGYVKNGVFSAPDAWLVRSTNNGPSPRLANAVVWTGAEFMTWGGEFFDGTYHYYNDLRRYNPATDTWAAGNNLNGPERASYATAVWTGSEMIIWGGIYNDGSDHYNTRVARYNPVTDTWTQGTTNGAPSGRYNHTAIWTGSEMLIWGGQLIPGGQADGARYNPVTDTWTTIQTNGAPLSRGGHSAVWTGTEMIVWGGSDANGVVNTGGRYNPLTDTWSLLPTSGLTPRSRHTAVWTGSEMIIWGGYNGQTNEFNNGARYNPASNSWAAISPTGAPIARGNHSAVWTGTEMIIWGGLKDFPGLTFNDGARYNPTTDSWTAITSADAPPGRDFHKAVWTGSEMIFFGGAARPGYRGDTYSYLPPRTMYLYLHQ